MRHTLTPFFQNMRPEETPESMEAVLGLPEKPPRKRWRKLPAETALPMRVPDTGNVIDDAGNAVKNAADDAGNVVNDVIDGAGDVVKDAADGVADGVKDMTGAK